MSSATVSTAVISSAQKKGSVAWFVSFKNGTEASFELCDLEVDDLRPLGDLDVDGLRPLGDLDFGGTRFFRAGSALACSSRFPGAANGSRFRFPLPRSQGAAETGGSRHASLFATLPGFGNPKPPTTAILVSRVSRRNGRKCASTPARTSAPAENDVGVAAHLASLAVRWEVSCVPSRHLLQ
tara:strand:+ start:2273 stop:2818 length:546 start_codon:yes stop_codon:yes gene_type:complete